MVTERYLKQKTSLSGEVAIRKTGFPLFVQAHAHHKADSGDPID